LTLRTARATLAAALWVCSATSARPAESDVSPSSRDGWCRVENRYAAPALCERSAGLRATLARLTAAAGFGGDVPAPGLDLDLIGAETSMDYRPEAAQLHVEIGFLRKYDPSGPATVYVASHELGHAVQFRVLKTVDALGAAGYTAKRVESEADVLGLQIALRAGYSAEVYVEGMRRFFGDMCRDPDLQDPSQEHPKTQDRLINVELYRKALVDAKLPGFAGLMSGEVLTSDPAGGGRPDFARVAVDSFDADTGLIRPSRVLPPAVARRLRAADGAASREEFDRRVDSAVGAPGLSRDFPDPCRPPSPGDLSEAQARFVLLLEGGAGRMKL
jgi:hypothetical protein